MLDPEHSSHLLDRERSILLVVDVQDKLLPVIANAAPLSETVKFLLDVAEVLHVPVVVSEQYPHGLGASVSAISDHVAVSEVFEKLRFSAAEGFQNSKTFGDLRSVVAADTTVGGAKPQVVIVGIEAHICVLQTAVDLMNQGVQVFVVEDAVGSRRPVDCQNGLRRINAAGGTICVSESVAFEWCEQAGTDEFRQISRLVRGRATSAS